jgi:paired amphipathic helix protein Sin3a
LNDDWVATLVFLSENGFTSHKKTIHEDAMFKCEEERYEFDLNIEANLSVINLLEPIAKKIQLMPAEERSEFKLLPGLGGKKFINSRILCYDIQESDQKSL